MNEIGGYHELSCLVNKPYYTDCIELNSARSCLELLIIEKKIKVLYIPFFLCETINVLCNKMEIKVVKYHLDNEFKPVVELSTFSKNDTFIYIVNYYGTTKKSDVRKYKEKYKNIILDNVQDFFLRPMLDIPSIYSCRKFFGVPDGAYLSNVHVRENNICEFSQSNWDFVIGRLDFSAQDFYIRFNSNEKRFINDGIKHMSKSTKIILGAIDYERAERRRTSNWQFLDTELFELNAFHLQPNSGPFAYVFYTKNNDFLREVLINNKIFIPTLWPELRDLKNLNHIEKKMMKSLILPCDQRYGETDMKKIISIIKENI